MGGLAVALQLYRAGGWWCSPGPRPPWAAAVQEAAMQALVAAGDTHTRVQADVHGHGDAPTHGAAVRACGRAAAYGLRTSGRRCAFAAQPGQA